MKVTDGIVTVVDHTNYDLTRKEAAGLLKNKKNVIAVEHPDFSQEHLQSVYQEPVVLTWQDYFELEQDEIIENLRTYEQFGAYNH
jgi:hypothetical protein